MELFSLEGLVSPAALGTLVIFGGCFCVCLISCKSNKCWQTKLDESQSKSAYTILLIISSYSIGFIIEDSADLLLDRNCVEDNGCSITGFITERLGTESYHRIDALFKIKEDQTCELGHLGKELFLGIYKLTENPNKRFVPIPIYDNKPIVRDVLDNLAFENFNYPKRCKNEPSRELKIVEALSLWAYYQSKNWVFGNPAYKDEMIGLQHRKEFLRSLYIVSFLLLPVIILSFVIAIGRSLKQDKKWVYATGQKRWIHVKELLREKTPIAILMIGILLCLIMLLPSAYQQSEIKFNERVYGYYSTFINTEFD